MASGRRAGLGLRFLGIAAAVFTAGTVLANDIVYDLHASDGAGIRRRDMKQAYRQQAAVLTCTTPRDPAFPARPSPPRQIVIAEPQARSPFFSFAEIDAAIDGDDCQLDTSPQTIWMALRGASPAAPTQTAFQPPPQTPAPPPSQPRRPRLSVIVRAGP